MCLQLSRFREEQVFWKDGRRAGSWPGTGLEEVGRISNGKSASVDLSKLQGSVRRIMACRDNCRLSSLAGLRKSEAAERCSCPHPFWTLRSVSYSSEIPTTTVCASSV